MKTMEINSKIKNKFCPAMIGTIKKLCGNGIAIIEIDDKYLRDTKELLICTENWEMID